MTPEPTPTIGSEIPGENVTISSGVDRTGDEEAMEEDGKNKEAMDEDEKKEDVKDEDTKKEEMKDEDAKNENVKDEDTKKEETKDEDAKKEETKDEDAKDEDVKDEGTKKEEAMDEDAKNENVKDEDTKKEEPGPEDIEKHTRMKRGRAIILAFSFSLIFISLYLVGFRETADALGSIEPWALGLAALLTFLVLFNDCLRWKVVLDALVKLPFRSLVPIFMGGMFVNNITPGVNSGGEIVRVYYITKESGKKASACAATVLLDALTLGFAFSIFLAFSLVFVFISPDVNLPQNVRILFGAGVLIVFLTVTYVIYLWKIRKVSDHEGRNRLDALLGWIYRLKPARRLREKHLTAEDFVKYVRKGMGNFKVTMGMLARSRGIVITATSMSVVTILLMYLRAYVLFLGMGEKMPFPALCAILTVAYMLGYLIILPGGIGVVESVMIALYGAYGIAPEVAAAVTVADRSLWYAFSFSGGYGSLIHLTGKYGKKKTGNGNSETGKGEDEYGESEP